MNTTFRSLLFLALLSTGRVAHAEPKRHTDFFEKDFAENVVNPDDRSHRRSGRSPQAPKAAPTATAHATGDKSEDTQGGGFVSESASPSPSPRPTPDEIAERDKMEATPVKSVGAILNSTPAEELYASIQKLVDLSLKFKYPVGTVTVIGALPPSNGAEIFGLTVRGGLLTAVEAVPEKYQVTKSPAWILETEKGEIVLEGFSSPEQFLNSKGDFVPKALPNIP